MKGDRLEFFLVVGIILGCAIALLSAAGCAVNMDPGQASINEVRTVGLDLSIPVPGVETVNIANVRMGWIEVKSYNGNKVPLRSNSKHTDINLLTGSGNVERIFEVGEVK